MLQSNTIANCTEFHKHQRIVKTAIITDKEEWICRTAGERERAIEDGRTRWESIENYRWQMQGSKQINNHASAVLKENGEPTKAGPLMR